ncbi:MAG: hypothetical protein HY238_16415 [Acidobacteria bacterium]|nr:hypothetical protein [Acidobacteriota bacterium]
MRFLVRATLPLEAGNALLKNPSMGKIMADVLGDLKPETVYYCVDKGQRTIYLVLTVQDASQIPSIVEPLWLALKADIEFIPAMNQAEFEKAVPGLERAVKKYKKY